MTDTTPSTYTARGPVDLIALAPYVLGFRPADSVVLMTFGGEEPFHVRVDLPATLAGQEQVSASIRAVVRKHRVPAAALLVYTEDTAAAVSQAEILRDDLDDDGVRLVDAIRVTDDAYFDALDPDDAGTPYDVTTHPLALRRIVDGQVVLESRQQLADTLVGADPDDVDAVCLAAARFADSSLAMLEKGLDAQVFLHDESRWLQRMLEAGRRRRLEPHEAGRVLVLLHRTDLRDVAWAAITADCCREHVDTWRDLVRRAPLDLVAPAAALLGFAAWLAGEGALAWCAVDRCREADPDNAMATEVSRLLEHAVPPSAWTGAPGATPPACAPPEPRSA